MAPQVEGLTYHLTDREQNVRWMLYPLSSDRYKKDFLRGLSWNLCFSWDVSVYLALAQPHFVDCLWLTGDVVLGRLRAAEANLVNLCKRALGRLQVS